MTNKITKENVQSLIKSTLDKNAVEFGKVFEALIQDTIEYTVESHKNELAATIFNEEKVEELSNKTLSSYVDKAKASGSTKRTRTDSKNLAQGKKIASDLAKDPSDKVKAGYVKRGLIHKVKVPASDK